jgi:hypothetical protein
MNSKYKAILFLSLLGTTLFCQTFQKSFKPELSISEIVSSHSNSSLLPTAGTSYFISNFINLDLFKESGLTINEVNTKSEIISSKALTIEGQKMACLKSILNGTDLYLLCTGSQFDFSPPNIHLIKYSISTQNIQWCKSLTGILSINQGDLLIHNNILTLICSSFGISYLIDIDLNGEILKSKKILSTDSLKSCNFWNATISNQNNVILAGTHDLETKLNKDISLIKLDENKHILTSKLIQFFDQNKMNQFRPWKVFLKTNGINIHLAVQAAVGRSDAGPILITMIDDGLNLRTWRNYSAEMNLEDFTIANGNFILSGQRPVTNGLEGYASARINASNAIPEKTTVLPWDSFKNFSIASSSSSLFNASNRTIVLFAKPNNDIENIVSIATFHFQNYGVCEDSFRFNVTKDPVEFFEDENIIIQDIALNSKSTSVQIHSIQNEFIESCSPTDIQDNSIEEIELVYNYNSREYILKSKNVIPKCSLQLISLDGKIVNKNSITIDGNYSLSLDKYPSGIYILNIAENTLGRKNWKLVKS